MPLMRRCRRLPGGMFPITAWLRDALLIFRLAAAAGGPELADKWAATVSRDPVDRGVRGRAVAADAYHRTLRRAVRGGNDISAAAATPAMRLGSARSVARRGRWQ
mmetsp:Transcript_121834/g.344573  ORF Transcript_121834/g.344573 Transcript_121834/m.344573 type:complete len:105 (-) Transcript_121834:153-467(-)